jgi:hypothetical protein
MKVLLKRMERLKEGWVPAKRAGDKGEKPSGHGKNA